jgi:CelD/BcsL family acetyltransferase involved in cellulose biosynthesis/ribosomal protein S18 acetylase RimI-like enzyme
MNIHIIRGAEAESLLNRDEFRADWLRLCARCPWATAFQQPDYGALWYDAYRSRFEPVFVLSRDEEGALNGLLTLALSGREEGLIVAGGRQAEYQTWICPPSRGGEFAWQAVRALQRNFPRAVLTFQYLAPGTPTAWLAAPEAARISRLASHRRPLVRFDREEGIESSLKKKRTRYRLKQLEKLGRLEFKRIRDPEEFEELFDTLIRYYDFRQEAVHGVAPFRNDSLKKNLIRARMTSRNAPPHATVLKIGDLIASAHVGMCSNKEAHLGLLAHNPFLAKHSPGKFHLLFLAQMLREEGYAQLDLTPGDNPYKEGFANDGDEVHTLTFFFSPGQRTTAAVRERVLGAVKRGIRTCRIEPARVQSLVNKLKIRRPVGAPLRLFRSARQWIGRHCEMRIYSFEAARVADFNESPGIRRDVLEDLLDYQAAEPGESRQAFLSTALARIEDGFHVYTYARNSCLQHYGWLAERQEKLVFGEGEQEFRLPAQSAYLFDFHTSPRARGRGFFTLSLQTMLQDAARVPGTEKIFLSVLADNSPARHVIEKVGFMHECSVFQEVRFGRARTWMRNSL